MLPRAAAGSAGGFHGRRPDPDLARLHTRRDPQRTAISRWGDLHGEGTRFVGPHSKLKLPMEVVVFRPARTHAPFVLMEMHALEEADLVKRGFDLIRNSFESRAD